MNSLVVIVAVVVAALALTLALVLILRRRPGEQTSTAQDELARRLLAEKDAAIQTLLAEKDAACRKLLEEKDRMMSASLNALREQFASLAAQKLQATTETLSNVNQKRVGELLRPLQAELDRFRRAFDENRAQQVANKSSFDQAIKDLGERALKIGADAENLAKALKSESKTQGDWGEMVLSNILSVAGLKEGVDFLPQTQETDAAGNRLIPDVEIPLPNGEKLLIDSKASVTAYLDYVAAQDDSTLR